MESLIAGLVVAAVSALSFVAYKHPNEYGRFSYVVYAACLVIVAILGALWVGVLAGEQLAYYPESKANLEHNILFAVGGVLGVSAYAIIIYYLQFWLRLGKKDEEQDKGDDKSP